MKKYLMLIGVLACVDAYALSPEDEAAIAAAFSETNTALQVARMVYPIHSNAWFNLSKTNRSYEREVQYAILTNYCSFRTTDVHFWLRNGLSDRRSLFDSICVFKLGTNDVAYLEKCADYLGTTMNPIAYEIDLRSGGYAWYNHEIVRSKREMIRNFRRPVGLYEKQIQSSDLPSFRTNIITRARLTPEEQRILWPVE